MKYRIWCNGINLWLCQGGATLPAPREFDTEQEALDFIELLRQGTNKGGWIGNYRLPPLSEEEQYSQERFAKGYEVVPYEGQVTTDKMRKGLEP